MITPACLDSLTEQLANRVLTVLESQELTDVAIAARVAAPMVDVVFAIGRLVNAGKIHQHLGVWKRRW